MEKCARNKQINENIVTFWNKYYVYQEVQHTIPAIVVFHHFTQTNLYSEESYTEFVASSGIIPDLKSGNIPGGPLDKMYYAVKRTDCMEADPLQLQEHQPQLHVQVSSHPVAPQLMPPHNSPAFLSQAQWNCPPPEIVLSVPRPCSVTSETIYQSPSGNTSTILPNIQPTAKPNENINITERKCSCGNSASKKCQTGRCGKCCTDRACAKHSRVAKGDACSSNSSCEDGELNRLFEFYVRCPSHMTNGAKNFISNIFVKYSRVRHFRWIDMTSAVITIAEDATFETFDLIYLNLVAKSAYDDKESLCILPYAEYIKIPGAVGGTTLKKKRSDDEGDTKVVKKHQMEKR